MTRPSPLAERAAQRQDDESGVPARYAEHDVSRYPAQVSSISWHLLADGYTITRAPAPAGCSLTLDRHGPRGEHAAYRGGGPAMQRAWDEGRTQLGPGEPQAAASSTRAAAPACTASCSTTTHGRSRTTPAFRTAARAAGGPKRSGR